ncbi:putative asparagine synthase [Chondrocystis sp. NIES-4102]|nr:putative asparagine synthase [Chondrocystis sp. NIES-4102]
MSAIAGIYYNDDTTVDPQHLIAINELLAHRGLDDSGIWQDNCIGLAHRMLWTTPESLREKLPYISENEEFVITADARIDNREELIKLLAIADIDAETITDSQLILSSYQYWGEACVDKLLGDFAFAIWDKQQQSLFCARDHFGVKPFYYYYSQKIFVFASEIKALFCVPEVKRILNEIRIAEFITSTFYDKEITIYHDILRLPPAHTLKVNSEGININSYWSLDPTYELKLGSDAEYSAKFKEIFAEAVRCRLRSPYPVGSMLSGGLDSSSITCMGRKILTEDGKSDLHTFSAIFDTVSQSDERYYMNAVIDGGGVKPHFINGDKISPFVDIEKVIWHQDEPQFAGNLYLNWKTYELANSLGVRVILDGFDGDSAVSHGFGYMRELAQAGRWLKLIPELAGYCRSFNVPFLPLFWTYFHLYALKPFMTKYKFLRFIYWRCKSIIDKINSRNINISPQALLSALLNHQLAENLNYKQHRRKLLEKSYIATKNEKEEHYNTINVGSISTTLELLDRTAAAFSTEVRYPFWDKRLVEFCLSLPANQKMRNGWTRMIMRRGMENILPKEIQWREGKGNLSYAFERGMQSYEQHLLEKVIDNDYKYIKDYINTVCYQEAYERFFSSSYTAVDAIKIWISVNLYLWFEHQINNQTKA